MSVFDASVYADALAVAGPAGDAARDALRDVAVLQAPEIFVTEVTSALRGLVLAGQLDEARARGALHRLRATNVETFPVEAFLERIWELRANLTVYDAAYVALAEELDTELVTADERLLTSTGPRCTVLAPADVGA